MKPALAAALCGYLLGGLLFSAQAATSASGLTVDDVLRMEDIGRIAIPADGESLIFERQPPYETAPNLEMLNAYQVDPSPLGKLYVTSTRRPADPQLLFEQHPRGGYWIGGLSPAGTKLAVYSLTGGEVKAGVVDLRNRQPIWFSFTPSYHPNQQSPVWISEDELVYPAMPPGEQPALVVFKPAIVARANALWSKSFSGTQPSVTVMNSTRGGIEQAEVFLPGKLMRVNARTGEATAMADGFFYSLRISPDGRYLAALKEAGAPQYPSDSPAVGRSERHQLVVFDLARKSAVVPCVNCNVLIRNIEWSADSARLLFFASELGQGLDRGRYFEYVPVTAVLTPVIANGLSIACRDSWMPVRAISIGGKVAVYARTMEQRAGGGYFSGRQECLRARGTNRYDWYLLDGKSAPVNLTGSLDEVSDMVVGKRKDAFFVMAEGDVWRLDAAGSPRNLTSNVGKTLRSWSSDILSILWRSRGRQFDVNRTGYIVPTTHTILETADRVIDLDLERQEFRTVVKSAAAGSVLLGISLAADVSVFRDDSVTGSARLMLRRGEAPARTVLTINAHLDLIPEPQRRSIPFHFRGEKLSVCALLPPGWTPARRYPAIVEVYPRSRGTCPGVSEYRARFSPWSNSEFFASRGYVVLKVPTANYVIEAPEAARDRSSIVLAAVDRAIEEGYVSADKLGIFGFSQGHLSALQVITETQRFRAAVVANGIADPVSHYGQLPRFTRLSLDDPTVFGWDSFLRWETTQEQWQGAKPWESPQAFIVNSPIFHADKIETPVLILHSDLDIFDLSQSEEMFAALYRLRKEARYVTYWGEGHNNSSPANIRDWWARVFDWYDRHLLQ